MRVARVIDRRDGHNVYDVYEPSGVILVGVGGYHGVQSIYTEPPEVGEHFLSLLPRSSVYEYVTSVWQPYQDAASLPDVEERNG